MSDITDQAPTGTCSPPMSTGSPGRPGQGYASGKADYHVRLRRIEGQIRGLQKMIEDDRWCPDVVDQVAAAIRALQEVAVGLLYDHVRHCLGASPSDSSAETATGLDEVAGVIRRVVRL